MTDLTERSRRHVRGLAAQASVNEAREAAFAAHAAARSASDAAACEAARAAGHADRNRTHGWTMSWVPPVYAIKAVRLASPAADAISAGRARELPVRHAEHLPDAIRELVLSDEERRNKKLWSVFT